MIDSNKVNFIYISDGYPGVTVQKHEEGFDAYIDMVNDLLEENPSNSIIYTSDVCLIINGESGQRIVIGWEQEAA